MYLKRIFLFVAPAVVSATMCAVAPIKVHCLSRMDVTDIFSIPASKWMSEPVHHHVSGECTETVHKMERLCMQLQSYLCKELELIDGKEKFFVDPWKRQSGGGGISCVMEDGEVFERAGINVSSIEGTLSDSAVKQMRSRVKDLDETKSYAFKACGISCVIHPRNPHIPTFHFNLRYFELSRDNGKSDWWFGGGCDLTPYYLDKEDVTHFHQTLKDCCDRHDPTYYSRFKRWCDQYFYLEHRKETRGVGGLFFDDLEAKDSQTIFEFVKSCAAAIGPSYLPIVRKHRNDPFTANHRQWQLLRRGRYVEFNLIHDRGTKFGLFTPEARIESILVSLPRMASWKYCREPNDPAEVELMEVLKSPREWV